MAKKRSHSKAVPHRTKRRKYPKRPKKPKMSASAKVWDNFDRKFKAWESKCRAIDAQHNHKEKLVQKYSHL